MKECENIERELIPYVLEYDLIGSNPGKGIGFVYANNALNAENILKNESINNGHRHLIKVTFIREIPKAVVPELISEQFINE